MHCSNCGSYIAPGKNFCSDCGARAEAPEATRIVRAQQGVPVPANLGGELLDDHEEVIFTVRPTLIFIRLGYALTIVAAIALVFLLALIHVSALISIPIALALL